MAIERIEQDSASDLGELLNDIDEACFRVTMLAIGVVSSLEKAPARKPTPSSSRMGRRDERCWRLWRRRCRRKL